MTISFPHFPGEIARFLACCFSMALALVAAPAAAQRLQTAAPYAILIDADGGAVLFEKSADALMAPASMAKIMTAQVLFDEIKRGLLTLRDDVAISENARRGSGLAFGGSTMRAAPGSRVKLSDLIAGLVVMSGNDAAIAIAEAVAGSEENFAAMMTRRARELNLTRSTFRNATGFSHPQQRTTAREMALLSRNLMRQHADLYPVFAVRNFTWNGVAQANRNPLLAMGIGADGVKTGHTRASGFGMVGSAVRNGRRLIVVVNGLKSESARAIEARKLLEWGFRGVTVGGSG